MKKKLFIGVVIIALAGTAYGLFLWNKPKREARGEQPVAVLTAAELFEAYAADADAANALYLDKVVQITGTCIEMETASNGTIIATFETDDPMSAITCTFTPGEKVSFKPGESGTVLGICAGLQGDLLPAVILSQCSTH